MKCQTNLLSEGKTSAFSRKINRIYVLCIAVFLLLLPVFSSTVLASTVGEEFKSVIRDDSKGLIVSIDKDNPNSIKLASTENNSYLLGVISNESDNGIVFSKEESDVVVSISGDIEVYVSDANGEIKSGDFVSTSWLEGVGMKIQDDKNQKILGVALEDYKYDDSVSYGEILTPFGPKSVRVSTISIRLLEKEAISNSILGSKDGLEKYVENIAGNEVSLLRIILGVVIFFVSSLVAALFVYSSIKGSFVSIGRNPMASNSIYRNLINVTAGSVTIILIGALLTYVILVV